MSCRVALVKTKVSEELSASIIRVARIGELGTLAITTDACCKEILSDLGLGISSQHAMIASYG
jgi:hypothetical protein